jgi:hypothetical protein
MNYTQIIYPDIKILLVRAFGELHTKEVALMDKNIRLKAKELNYKIIYDFRDTANHMSIADAYNWFADDDNNVLFKLRNIPVVKITNEHDESFFNFFELTSNNKGGRIKTCKDEISAFKWLGQF